MTQQASRSIYLAGPFFSPEQLRTIEDVEVLCEAAGVVCNSPRKFMVLKPRASWEDRRRVFNKNCDMIKASELVLACIDGREDGHVDTGTAWEMGYAAASLIPVVCFTLSGKRMNVMLAQGCQGFLPNYAAVEAFLRGKATGHAEMEYSGRMWEWDWEVAQAWRKDIF